MSGHRTKGVITFHATDQVMRLNVMIGSPSSGNVNVFLYLATY